MRSRWVRLISCVLAFAAIGAAAFFVNHSEQQIARNRGAERAFNTAVRDVINGVSDLRISQAAYVATGQDVAFWAPKATAAAENVIGSVTLLRSAATTDAARAALDAARTSAALFADIDRHARDYLDQGMPVMAGDVILSDGGETAAALVGQIEAARTAEQDAAAAGDFTQRRSEAIAATAAAAIALLAIVLLTPRTRLAASPIAQPETIADAPPSMAREDVVRQSTSDNLSSFPSLRPAGASLRAVSRLCTDFGRVKDVEELKSLLLRAASLMEASGLMVWVGSHDGSELQPALAHGYTPDVLARMPTLRRSADNAAAAAFRSGKLQIVLAQEGSSSGAIVAPMLSSRGCVGVMSVETQRGAETSESLQALAAIVAAQLAGILQTTAETQEQQATGTI
jgi:hypothetical protein